MFGLPPPTLGLGGVLFGPPVRGRDVLPPPPGVIVGPPGVVGRRVRLDGPPPGVAAPPGRVRLAPPARGRDVGPEPGGGVVGGVVVEPPVEEPPPETLLVPLLVLELLVLDFLLVRAIIGIGIGMSRGVLPWPTPEVSDSGVVDGVTV